METVPTVTPQKKVTKKDERAKKIEEAIRLTYDSLQSHLPYTHEEPDMTSRDETKAFHCKSVKEYVRLLTILTELY